MGTYLWMWGYVSTLYLEITLPSDVESVCGGVTGGVRRGRQKYKHDVNTVFMNEVLKTLNYIGENGDFNVKNDKQNSSCNSNIYWLIEQIT